MKTTAAICAAILTGTAVCEELKTLSDADRELLKKPYTSLSAEEKTKRDALAKLRYMIEEGGEMVRPGTPVGKVLVVNRQKKVSMDALRKFTEPFAYVMEYDIRFTEKESPAEIVLDVVDVPGERALAVYPDEGRGVINVAALAADKPAAAFLDARTRKEMLRAFAYLTAGSSYGTPLFARAKTVKDLDDIATESFPVDVSMRTMRYLKDLGMRPIERATYRSLVNHGYEIAPTNGYQKAIYEKAKANPRRRKPNGRK